MPDQASPSPTRKVVAGGIAGSASTVLVWILNSTLFVKNPMPAEVAVAFSTILSGIASYYTKPHAKDLAGAEPPAVG